MRGASFHFPSHYCVDLGAGGLSRVAWRDDPGVSLHVAALNPERLHHLGAAEYRDADDDPIVLAGARRNWPYRHARCKSRRSLFAIERPAGEPAVFESTRDVGCRRVGHAAHFGLQDGATSGQHQGNRHQRSALHNLWHVTPPSLGPLRKRWVYLTVWVTTVTVAVSYTHLRAHETDSYLVC